MGNAGVKANVLGGFFIGAHGAGSGMPVLTQDTARHKTYFPSVRLVAPA